MTTTRGRHERTGHGNGSLRQRSGFSKRAIPLLAAIALVVALVPGVAVAWNVSMTPVYDWYGDGSASTFRISNVRQYRGFVELVCGTADMDADGIFEQDSFAGKTVALDANLNFMGQTITPAGGGAYGTTFDGTFDGQGHSMDNFVIDLDGLVADGAGVGASISDLGVIGSAGQDSLITNVSIGSNGRINIVLDETNTATVENIGLLVGSSQGSISSCQNSGTITILNPMDQTREAMFPIRNVGGLGGIVLGDITSCDNNGRIDVTESGGPHQAQTEIVNGKIVFVGDDAGGAEINVLVCNVGGIVGSAGDVDSTAIYGEMALPDGYLVSNTHGSISNCSNSGTIHIDTPCENGVDRMGNPIHMNSSNVGGIAGYSRGDVSSCLNSGYIDADKGNHVAGIVGGWRSTMVTDNFSTVGTDDGLMMHEQGDTEYLNMTDCQNDGLIRGYAFVGGMVGTAGSYTSIDTCMNSADAYVLGTRSSKPFASGIVGSCYGEVAYCANLGTIASGDWTDPSDPYSGQITTRGGYYCAGICGVVAFHQIRVEGVDVRADQPMPEVHGCYNAGSILAIDGMRQRAIVGDNSGWVHDNVSEQGKVYNDLLVYGMLPNEVGESTSGTIERNILLTNAQLTGNEPLTAAQMEQYLGIVGGDPATDPIYPLAILNKDGAVQGIYWVKSDGSANGGYPVLSTKVTWDPTSIANATVTLKADAPYTGLPSAPTANVALDDGTVLIQDVDFVVVADPEGIEISSGAPYVATVNGIGNYDGTASQTLHYDVVKGDLADCAVIIENATFNWDPQTPSADDVQVSNAGGATVDPSEYVFYLDPSDRDLTDGQAVNAKTYT
ncbi:MAG: hypothetical protein IJJ14_03520, partial [Coriobacteriales bacterium]|nr:hypothetical protein [Coriobacteriales bacterium]